MERAVRKADFGEGERTIIRKEEVGKKGAHFAASVDFFTVKCGNKEFKIVGKIPPESEFARNMMHSDIQFATEVLMYKEILPFLGVEDLFPTMYYGQAEGKPEEDVILIEDMGPRGYKITDERLFLSVEHLRLAVKWLGKFHAASITAKAARREGFDALVSRIKYAPWSDEEDTSVEQCMARGIKPHLHTHGDVLGPALEAMQDKSFYEIVTTPKEPWAVVCHGDFCRNNVLFKYEGDKPVSIKPFDLQTSRYTSPAIDLSFLLYLNSDKDTRDVYWDSLLKDYLDSLKSNLPPSITLDDEDFYEDFASRAVYGYFHCSFFTPMMTLENPPGLEDYASLTLEQRIENMVNMGGERGTELISSIVGHLLEKGYINKFLDLVKRSKITS